MHRFGFQPGDHVEYNGEFQAAGVVVCFRNVMLSEPSPYSYCIGVDFAESHVRDFWEYAHSLNGVLPGKTGYYCEPARLSRLDDAILVTSSSVLKFLTPEVSV